MNETKEAFFRLYEIIQKLRAPDGCPWDIEQTPFSMRSCLLEESYEAIEAITDEDFPHICEELGDVFLDATMIAYMCEQEGRFSVADSLNQVSDKIVRRHPHVFKKETQGSIKSADEVLTQWDAIKSNIEGRKQKSLMDEVSKGLPSIKRAEKIQYKAAKVGFDWDTPEQVWNKVEEEITEVKTAAREFSSKINSSSEKEKKHLEEEIGDLLFTVINLSRKYKVDPEQALLSSTNKFVKRFKNMEEQVKAQNVDLKDCSIIQKEKYWQMSKKTVL